MYAIYEIQPDDRNHLIIYDGETRIMYIRPNGRELKQLLQGDASFVEYGAWSEEAKRDYYKVAELFREKKIEYIVFKNYPGVKSFRYKVKPENLEVNVSGLMNVEYVLHLEDKDVVIKPFVRDYTSDYPFKVEVYEYPKKPVKREQPVKVVDKQYVVMSLAEIYSMLSSIKSSMTKSQILNTVTQVRRKVLNLMSELSSSR